MGNTSIEWTDKTWNPTRGCSPVSPGCKNCYAERQGGRFCAPGEPFEGFIQIGKNGKAGPHWTGKVDLIASKLEEPLHWRKPVRVFVNSMSDLFHEALDDEAISAVFAVMSQSPQHTFQILTKRPARMLSWFSRWNVRDGVEESGMTRFDWCHSNTENRWPLPNVWLGVSVENHETANERIPLLLQTPATVRFVSYEPALGPVDFTKWICGCGVDGGPFEGMCNGQHRLHWIIVGGESGADARPFDIAWARNTVAQCKAGGVACFVKQLGARITGLNLDGPPYSSPPRREGFLVHWTCRANNTFGLCDRKGGDPFDWPEDLRVREFPHVAVPA